jgi:hypothetical protein
MTTAKKKTLHKQRVMSYLKKNRNKGLNPVEAWGTLGVYRLSAVIYSLREDGVNIDTFETTTKNRFGEKMRVALYKLAS